MGSCRRAAAAWTPRELRHSFVSLMSDAGVPIEKIARLVGHTGTTTTETIYRKQIRPVVVGGAEVMDSLFPSRAPTLNRSQRHYPERSCLPGKDRRRTRDRRPSYPAA